MVALGMITLGMTNGVPRWREAIAAKPAWTY